jgi:hypothetical protein
MVELDETALRNFLRERRWMLFTLVIFLFGGLVVTALSWAASAVT